MSETKRLPLSIVTGFLGSGKTTLIRHLLEHPALAGTLVIVNEFGEVGIDHLLLEASSDDTILLANGCLCCTIRGNLVDTLLDVLAQRREGRLGAFDRVLVETSGVADPAPLLAFLLGDAQVMASYRLDALIATCDLVSGAATLARHLEAQNQLRLADRILLTKRDLVAEPQVAVMTREARKLNPAAEILAIEHGRVDPLTILAPPGQFLREAASAQTSCADAHDHAHDHLGHAHDPHGEESHSARFRCAILGADRKLTRNEMNGIMATLRRHAGLSLLRVKGVIPVDFDERMLVLQGALMVVHEPDFLDTTATTGRLVVITEGPAAPELLSDLAALGLPEARRDMTDHERIHLALPR